ncbi:MAG TPA: SH3 domain-containing protein [Nitrospirales bacterium]|nr:SH3 domain-containing protein [Nitrospirales bacterium]
MSSRTNSVLLAVAFAALASVCGTAFAETVYVQAKSAKLRAGKTSLDRVVADLAYGQPVDVLRRDGDWVEVKTSSGAIGWLFANKVGATKPAGDDKALAFLGKSMRHGEAGEVTASAGARGLDKASESYANRTGITKEHRDAVDRMTAYTLSDQEVEDFLKAGKLGEYR